MPAELFAALLLATAHTPDIAACEARLIDYADWRETSDAQWALDLTAPNDGRLIYIGAEHSRDPAAGQFAEIEAAFRAASPTLVFYEGPDRGLAADARATIETRGESGFVRWLAAQAGAATAGLEPSPVDQARALLADFPADQVFLFFIVREAVRLRDRDGLSAEALDQATERVLGQSAGLAGAAGVEAPFTDLAGLQAAWRRYWGAESDWRAAPSAWFDPNADDALTGGRFLAAINAASSGFRDVHMYRTLARAALSGERVFAVVGRNHVPMQADALRCALAN